MSASERLWKLSAYFLARSTRADVTAFCSFSKSAYTLQKTSSCCGVSSLMPAANSFLRASESAIL